jgi:hypothetical protein
MIRCPPACVNPFDCTLILDSRVLYLLYAPTLRHVTSCGRVTERLLYSQQHLQRMRRNVLPVEFINWSLLMRHEDLPGALIELLEISETPSSSNLLLHHPPEASDGVEMVATMGG